VSLAGLVPGWPTRRVYMVRGVGGQTVSQGR
jgi:hypothetical protein